MTAPAVGRYWRQATPEQQKRLQDEFKLLLVRTYSGALSQVSAEQTVELKPMRSSPTDTEVVVRTEIRGKGDPIQLDYRLEKAGDGWKIYDVNVLGVWLVENYRNSFAQEIGANGIDGLIAKMAERNKSAAGRREELMLLLPATLTSREARVTLRMLQQALQSEGSEDAGGGRGRVAAAARFRGAGGAARDRAARARLGSRLRRARRAGQAGRAGQALRRRRPAAQARAGHGGGRCRRRSAQAGDVVGDAP